MNIIICVGKLTSFCVNNKSILTTTMTIGLQNDGLCSQRILCPRIMLPHGEKIVTPEGSLNWDF